MVVYTSQQKYHRSEKGKLAIKRGHAKYNLTQKGKLAAKRAQDKLKASGYYKYGKGAHNSLKTKSRIRQINFNLTYAEFLDWWRLEKDVCFYCNMTLDEYRDLRNKLLVYMGNNSTLIKMKKILSGKILKKVDKFTIDRKNDDLGYEISNMAKACLICNIIK